MMNTQVWTEFSWVCHFSTEWPGGEYKNTLCWNSVILWKEDSLWVDWKTVFELAGRRNVFQCDCG